MDILNKCKSVVLNLLYDVFPNSIDINTHYIEGKDVPKEKRALMNFDDEMKSWGDPGNTSQSNPIKSEIMVYQETIFHLRDEGYIQSKEPEHGKLQKTFFECKLTSKGLAEVERLREDEISESNRQTFATVLDNKFIMMSEEDKIEWSRSLTRDEQMKYAFELKNQGKTTEAVSRIIEYHRFQRIDNMKNEGEKKKKIETRKTQIRRLVQKYKKSIN